MSGTLAVLVRLVLAVLAVYHLTTGLLALVAPARARRLMHALYAARLEGSAAMDYATAMIGAQALAIGALAANAIRNPDDHHAIVAVLAYLPLVRAAVRIIRARTLRDALQVPASRNGIAIAALLAEAAVLLAFLA